MGLAGLASVGQAGPQVPGLNLKCWNVRPGTSHPLECETRHQPAPRIDELCYKARTDPYHFPDPYHFRGTSLDLAGVRCHENAYRRRQPAASGILDTPFLNSSASSR